MSHDKTPAQLVRWLVAQRAPRPFPRVTGSHRFHPRNPGIIGAIGTVDAVAAFAPEHPEHVAVRDGSGDHRGWVRSSVTTNRSNCRPRRTGSGSRMARRVSVGVIAALDHAETAATHAVAWHKGRRHRRPSRDQPHLVNPLENASTHPPVGTGVGGTPSHDASRPPRQAGTALSCPHAS